MIQMTSACGYQWPQYWIEHGGTPRRKRDGIVVEDHPMECDMLDCSHEIVYVYGLMISILDLPT